MTQSEADKKMQDDHNRKVEDQLAKQSEQLIAISTSLELILQSTKSDKETFTEFKAEVKAKIKELEKKADDSALYRATNATTMTDISLMRTSIIRMLMGFFALNGLAMAAGAYIIMNSQG